MTYTNRVNSRKHQAGLGKLTLLVFGALTGAALYTAYEVLPFYYYFYELENQMEAAIRVASTETDDELRKKLTYHIRKMDLPVGTDEDLRDALKIERDDNIMRISLPYEEVFSIPLGSKTYILRRFKFNAYMEGQFK